MMVRFSCFHGQIHSHKSKKAVERSAETMHKTLEDCSQNQDIKASTNPTSLNSLLLRAHEDTRSNISTEQVRSSHSIENCWKLDEMNGNSSPEVDMVVHQKACLKKCQSLGSGLDRQDRISGNIDTEHEIYQEFSCYGSHDHNGFMEPHDSKDVEMNSVNQYQEEAVVYESFPVNSDAMRDEPIFSIGDPKQVEREVNGDDFDSPLSGEHDVDYGDQTPFTQHLIAKSYSLPNMGPTSREGSHSRAVIRPRCRSSEDLGALDVKKKEFLKNEARVMVDQRRVSYVSNTGKEKCENPVGEGCDSCSYVGLSKDWIVPGTDEVGRVKNFQGESLVHQWEEMPSKEFNLKRIEEWVSDLQHRNHWEETGESSHSNDQVKRGPNTLDVPASAKLGAKIVPGMEAAKKYISSLTATSTTAQLANHGLVVLPFMSVFVSLRAINLSGNAIVRITAGALPRGLHMLNLSKNNISTIEGLRELTRLRVLDLSYNRIFRIGHGLASCSSLKELYLAGNKISEVEGLHRLLKLNVLDLRFNKISTAKCLGQLAANYSSLQAISLEGNPAQRNVGDEQLKKYLQGLLPHLAYFNRQPMKVSSLKDTSDRTARSGINMHQFDRSLRLEQKPTRKGGHSVGTHKPLSSFIHGRTSQAAGSLKRSKARLGRLPPSGPKGTAHNHHNPYLDLDGKVLGFRMDLSMRRSRSEGTLGAS